jgi:FKBP-type peptidyl-prolyl cis-trans isomerase
MTPYRKILDKKQKKKILELVKYMVENMKNMIFIIATISLIISLIGCYSEPKPNPNFKLTDFADSLSYSLGFIYAVDMSDIDFELNKKALVTGFVNALFDIELLTEDEMMDVFDRFHEQMMTKRFTQGEHLRMKNQLAGETFMTENALKPGVVTTDSGLQYRVIKSGTGKQIQAGDNITAHYTAKFLDGEVFQTTLDRPEPLSFDIDLVLPGWNEGLKLMREGDKWELFLPDNLAFGTEGFEAVEPGAYLIFEVEVIRVN